jgi:hypothetical protein
VDLIKFYLNFNIKMDSTVNNTNQQPNIRANLINTFARKLKQQRELVAKQKECKLYL